MATLPAAVFRRHRSRSRLGGPPRHCGNSIDPANSRCASRGLGGLLLRFVMTTDTSEKGLESLIMRRMCGVEGLEAAAEWLVAEKALPEGSGWIAGNPKDFDRGQAIDVAQLFAFLRSSQAEEFKKLGIADYKDSKDIARLKFLSRLSSEIGKNGV